MISAHAFIIRLKLTESISTAAKIKVIILSQNVDQRV